MSPIAEWTVWRLGVSTGEWVVIYSGTESRARMRFERLVDSRSRGVMKQGGVRLVSPADIVCDSAWRRHVRGSMVERVTEEVSRPRVMCSQEWRR
ncbi:MAG: hypothetical protein KIT73_10150 [Burkholderiales bacterium]|nr:hypothetical protein [Burkholderiales bacterium]